MDSCRFKIKGLRWVIAYLKPFVCEAKNITLQHYKKKIWYRGYERIFTFCPLYFLHFLQKMTMRYKWDGRRLIGLNYEKEKRSHS